MKKTIYLRLVLLQVFAHCACGSSKTVVGTWTGKMDATKFFEEEADFADYAPYMKDANFDLRLEMKENNTFVLVMDATSLKPAIRDAFEAYLDNFCQEQGMTREDFAAAAGQTIDQLLDSAMEEFDPAEINQTINGTYSNAKGMLTCNYDDGTSSTGSWEGDTLTLSEPGVGDINFARSK